MTRVLIACPVLRREWIIKQYLEHASVAADKAGVEACYLMIGALGDPTFDVVDALPAYDVMRVYIEEDRAIDKRRWSNERKERMVHLRNVLLNRARHWTGLDYLLSLDSDILVHPDLIGNLIETQQQREWDAVGGYCYLSSSRSHPSYANLQGFALRRPAIVGQVERCNILMAIKLMTAPAWNVDYEYHRIGEDIGWSLAVERAGLKVGVDARVVNRHVMRPLDLGRDDPRVDW